MTLPYLDTPTPIAIAHRGGSVAAPENTVAAFRHAWSLGYRYLETDVHLTSDGVLVAFHDGDLERLAGLPGTIEEQPWEALQAIDLGGGNGIPIMAQLLETFPEAKFNIDPKEDNAVEPLGDLIEEAEAVHRVGVGSFDDTRVATFQHRFGADLCTSPGLMEMLAFFAGETTGDAFAGHGCLQIPPRFGDFEITSELLDQAHDLGLQVHLWTINEEAEMNRLLDLGVDAIMTDDTQLLKDVLVRRGEWNEAPQ